MKAPPSPKLLCPGRIEAESALPNVVIAAGSRLRRDLMAEGGVAPVAATASAAVAAAQNLGGMEEKFAFR